MNGKNLALLLAILGAAAVLFNQQTATKVSEFQTYKQQFGIEFASEFENTYREKIFLENLAKINAHNSNEFRTYDQGVNQFSHLTQQEFVEQYLGLIVKGSAHSIESTDDLKVGDVDWVAAGSVTDVKNQGQCGSCWAFSATGGLEGLSKSKGQLESFSEQQLVDCSGSFGNQACNGGLMDNAFKYVKQNGIVHEDEYPYKAVKQTCKINSGPFKIGGFVDIKTCNDLASAITGRPISVAVDATNWSTYKSGVFNNCKTSLNHGVLLVGITDQYWWIKNSWGTTWGEKGFVRLARGNTCGICNVASYPTA
jgi:C1A family cysteine protease